MRKDILLDDDLDLLFTENDVTIGESDNQHVRLLLEVNEGGFTQFPSTGVGIMNYLKSSFDGTARRNVQLQLEGDNYRINRFNFDVETGLFDLNYSSDGKDS
jgi:hypothetical protein